VLVCTLSKDEAKTSKLFHNDICGQIYSAAGALHSETLDTVERHLFLHIVPALNLARRLLSLIFMVSVFV